MDAFRGKPPPVLTRGNAQRRANPKVYAASDVTGAGGLEPPTVALTVQIQSRQEDTPTMSDGEPSGAVRKETEP